MPLTVLSDNDVKAVLDTITKEDVLDIHWALADALYQYSTVTDADYSGCAAANQPSRIAVKSKDGSTTLFMPASSDSAFGVKIVKIAETSKSTPSTATLPDVKSLLLSDSSSDSVSKQSGSSRTASISPTASRTATSSIRSSSPSIPASGASTRTSNTSSSGLESNRSTRTSNMSESGAERRSGPDPDHPSLLFPGTKVDTPLSATSPRGSITLLSESGEPRALINASTLTAFRTALVSTILLKFRHSVHDVLIFGAGLQAFWHLFISLLLRGDEIHHINVVNRDFSRAQRLLMSLSQTNNEDVSDMMLHTKLKSSILTPDHVEYGRLLKENVRSADVIFCTTPATAPLFPPTYLTHSEGRRKARYIAAIGSYKPHMQELHEDILHQAVEGPGNHHNHHGVHLHHRHAEEGGAIVVDTIEGCMREAGEIIKAGIAGHNIVELGELVMLKIDARARARREERGEKERAETSVTTKEQQRHHGPGHLLHGKKSGEQQQKHDGGLMQWLQRGNVIYKGVGIGLMDVVVGMEEVRLAEERRIGTFVDDF